MPVKQVLADDVAQSSPDRLLTAARIVWAVELLLAPEAAPLCGSVLHASGHPVSISVV
jgi:hypothetical protein